MDKLKYYLVLAMALALIFTYVTTDIVIHDQLIAAMAIFLTVGLFRYLENNHRTDP